MVEAKLLTQCGSHSFRKITVLAIMTNAKILQ
jgi:hypothetical protein